MDSTGYPRILRRIQGALIDGLIIPITAIGALALLSYSGVEDGIIKAIMVGILILILEPLLVSFTGGTIGHHLVGLRVRQINEDKKLNPFFALIRFIVKVIFGLPAFFAVFLTKRRQALHDLAARSVIVYKSTSGLPDHELLQELTRDNEHSMYVSVWRRMLVIVIYWFMSIMILGIVSSTFVSDTCIEQEVCTANESLVLLIGGLIFFVALILITVLGWRGYLYGSRKKQIVI